MTSAASPKTVTTALVTTSRRMSGRRVTLRGVGAWCWKVIICCQAPSSDPGVWGAPAGCGRPAGGGVGGVRAGGGMAARVPRPGGRYPRCVSDDRIVWIDCEMTGLDAEADALVEVACLVTDAELNVLGEGVDARGGSGEHLLDRPEPKAEVPQRHDAQKHGNGLVVVERVGYSGDERATKGVVERGAERG